MKRRTVLEVLGAGVAARQLGIAQHHLVTLAQSPESYKPRFFGPAQIELVSQLSEMIIPADDHSPGAREAKVSLFIDLMIAHSDKDVQELWNSGLKLVEATAQERFHRPFLECGPPQQDEILVAMAAGETDPQTPLQQFFVRLKLMTIDGYYTSQIGIHRELQYKGNAVLAEFPGCRHTNH